MNGEQVRRRFARPIIMLPNGFTLLNLFLGVFAIVTASRGNYATAATYIVLGGVADAFDGRIARATRSGSRFGAELDSLVDAITFGLAPALLMFSVVPAAMVTVPVKLLFPPNVNAPLLKVMPAAAPVVIAPLTTSVPAPCLIKVNPVPVIAPIVRVFAVTVTWRFVAFSATEPVPKDKLLEPVKVKSAFHA